MRRALIVVLLGVLAGSGHALAAPAPLRVTSISPAVVERGGLVTITGGGFGARNLDVSVGGERVGLVSATGSSASFRVPVLGPVGQVKVRATNPGGHSGEIGLTVRFDGHAAAVVDEAAAVAEAIGADGGSIAVAGMELAIPAGAVPEGTTITATPLRSLRGSPFAAAPVGVKLEPSGLVLLQPATLTLPRPSGPGTLVGFGFNGDGEGFRLLPHRVVGETVELKVWHFSGAGVLTARLEELEAVLSYEPAPAHELAEQRIAAALVDAQVNGSDPGTAIAIALRNWRTSSVRQGLQIAGTESRLDFFELAFGEWLAWLAYLQEYHDTLAAADAGFFDRAAQIDRATATNSAAAVTRRQLERCLGPSFPRSALRDVIRVASAVNLAGLPIEDTETSGGERQLPSGPNLASGCVDVQITAVEHAAAFARNRNNLFQVRAQVVFWSGDPSTTIP
ncbi:MAG TPA: IPT/TIG domain-containing protein, partial [Gaiellaceae bacterium]|nr:IPT/TIG domain-containing protein [Gaiellaceae bacterium]